VKLEFFPAAPALNRHVSVYYRIRVDQARVEDVERADVGYFRFFLNAAGTIHYASGISDNVHQVALHGPATETGHYVIEGPLDCFGAVLLPDFWDGLVDGDATDCANRCMNGVEFFGAEAQALFDQLQMIESIEDMAKLLDAFLIRRIKPLPADQIKVIDRIGDWLRCFPIPQPDALYENLDISERQATRIANRHFGAPPKMLARKFRALRTASRLIGTKGAIPKILIDEYSDRAHLSREVKQFTGLTPKQLQFNTNPIVQVTLHPDNFRADAPWT
jgi:AraC-like DNA-binding protein